MPLLTVAIFVCGLKDSSRIMIKLSGKKTNIDRIMIANIADSLNFLAWSKTEDSRKNINRPKRFTDIILGTKEEEKLVKFQSGEDFLKAWNNEV